MRFIVEDHRIREVKDAISRQLLEELERAEIPVASATMEVVGVPPLRFEGPAEPRPGGR